MAQEYTIEKVSQQQPRQWDGPNGTVYYIKVKLAEHDKPVDIGKKSPDALKAGDKVYGTITEGQYDTDKFKAEKNPNGFTGGGKYTRDDSAIQAQWALGRSYEKHGATEQAIKDAQWLFANIATIKAGSEPKKDWVKPEVREKLQPKEETPPVDAYDNINEDTEINLDDIPF